MKINKLLSGLIAVAASSASIAGPILSEGFEDVSSLSGKGWTLLNNSAPVGSATWFQGAPTVFVAASGPTDSYLGANYLSGAVNAGGTIDDWALTPVMALAASVQVSFDLRLLGDGFLDTVQVYVSTHGASSTLSDFTLLATYASATDTGWQNKTVDLSGISGVVNGRIAFRYVAANTDSDGNYIGIDTFEAFDAAPVPEPGSLALGALALGALAVTRRRKTA